MTESAAPLLARALKHLRILRGRNQGDLADPKRLGESVIRAKLRASGVELRHQQEWLGEVVDVLRWQGAKEASALDPADRRLCEWAEEQRREVMRLAVRFERRVGPAP